MSKAWGISSVSSRKERGDQVLSECQSEARNQVGGSDKGINHTGND